MSEQRIPVFAAMATILGLPPGTLSTAYIDAGGPADYPSTLRKAPHTYPAYRLLMNRLEATSMALPSPSDHYPTSESNDLVQVGVGPGESFANPTPPGAEALVTAPGLMSVAPFGPAHPSAIVVDPDTGVTAAVTADISRLGRRGIVPQTIEKMREVAELVGDAGKSFHPSRLWVSVSAGPGWEEERCRLSKEEFQEYTAGGPAFYRHYISLTHEGSAKPYAIHTTNYFAALWGRHGVPWRQIGRDLRPLPNRLIDAQAKGVQAVVWHRAPAST